MSWQPSPAEQERIPPTTVQLEVVKPVVAEPSSPRIVEPEPVVVAEPVTAAEPVAASPAFVRESPGASETKVEPVSAGQKPVESLFPGKPADPAVSVPAPAAPSATTRRRRTGAVSTHIIDDSVTARLDRHVAPRLDEPVLPHVAEPVVPRLPDAPAPRVEQSTAPRVEQSTAPRVEQSTAPRVEQSTVRRVEQCIAPRVEQSTAPRVEQSTAPRVEQSTAPRVEQSTAPRVEQSTAPRVDEFERAARLFAFTGEQPTVSTAPATPVSPVATTAATDGPTHTAPRTRRARRITAASLSLAAIGAVGLLTVGMTLPSEAVAAATGTPDATMTLAGDVNDGGDGDIQAYVASGSSAGGVQGSLQRSSGFTTGTEVQLAGTAGITNVSGSTFSNNQNCPVQWPFAVGVPITYGFGPRPGEFHEGVDFTPGMGAHIQAIADGVVAVAQDNYQGYGTAVIIDHVINGQKVASLYGHMELGSLQVHVGEKVKVGEYIGRTGNTGHSFGAHTHVEIRQNDVTPIDPLPWLRAHNQC